MTRQTQIAFDKFTGEELGVVERENATHFVYRQRQRGKLRFLLVLKDRAELRGRAA